MAEVGDGAVNFSLLANLVGIHPARLAARKGHAGTRGKAGYTTRCRTKEARCTVILRRNRQRRPRVAYG